MESSVAVILLLCLLICLGCGTPASQEFIDRTPYSPSYLASIWEQSQQIIATQPVQLNIWERGAAAVYSHPDKRAVLIDPDFLLVESVPDWLPNSNCILEPYDDGACVEAYSEFGKAVYYASGLNGSPHLQVDLRYEFDSQILYRLGYDVHWR